MHARKHDSKDISVSGCIRISVLLWVSMEVCQCICICMCLTERKREVAAVGAAGPQGLRRRQTQLDASRGGQDVLTAS